MPSRDVFAMNPAARADGVALMRSVDAEAAVDNPVLSAAPIVVMGFGSAEHPGVEGASAQVLSPKALEWLRSPARFSIAIVLGTCERHQVAAVVSCDIVLMTQSAVLVASEAASSTLPGLGASEVLVSRIGRGRSLLLALDEGPLDSSRAHAIGLVDEVVADEQVADRIDQLIAAVHAMPPGWIAEAASLTATALGVTHEAAGRERLRRREGDALDRLNRQREGISD